MMTGRALFCFARTFYNKGDIKMANIIDGKAISMDIKNEVKEL